MILSKYNLGKINVAGLELPGSEVFELPEKVLQFGTGVLLRGLPDYFIDKANRQGLFNGRIVVVKSTGAGSTSAFDKQDGLYTIYLKGIENAQEVSEQVVCSAISRVISAAHDWAAILEVAASPDLRLIISNTTEIGIQLIKEDIRKCPPVSYPGKLLAILHERYNAFNGNNDSGLVIIPTELIVDNGKKLEAIVLELAHLNKLEPAFMDWLESSNTFCNSLVDRIVPGEPDKDLRKEMENARGYTDDLNIISEKYSLWAIEGDEKVASVLSFSKADKSVIITPDIELYRELKLRLLNGTHTLSCAVAILSGFDTVKEAIENDGFSQFIHSLVFHEILPAIPYPVDVQAAKNFAGDVLNRFRNPFIRHEWLSISAQYSTKIKMRVLPLLFNYYKINNSVPAGMAFAFAAFIRFMKLVKTDDDKFAGSINGKEYIVNDVQAACFCEAWEHDKGEVTVVAVLKNKDLWDADLTLLPGFAEAVSLQLNDIVAKGIIEILNC